MKLLLASVLLHYLLWLANGQNIIPVDAAGTECPPCDCSSRQSSCAEKDIKDPCSCCRRCFKGKGEVCGEIEGECTNDLLCLPDDPYSADYKGKCYEITPCLTFGCDEVSGEKCECFYNNVCPLQRLPYYTKEECEDTIKIKKCKDVKCPVNLEEKTCDEGMYFEEGPSMLEHCCPIKGRCVCNVTLCAGPPDCPPGEEVVMTMGADPEKGKCCNEYACERNKGCKYNNVRYSYGDKWMDGSKCTTCICTENGAECTAVNCTELTCSITYIPEGECCPVCFESTTNTVNNYRPPDPVPASGCTAENGDHYDEGDEWRPHPCRDCRCVNGEIDCTERVCDVIICSEEEEYHLPEGYCCPICRDRQVISLSTNATPSSSTAPSPLVTSITMATTRPPLTPSNTPTTPPMETQKRLVLLLNVPYKEVMTKWNEFLSELNAKLKEKKIEVKNIKVTPDNSQTINGAVLTLTMSEGVSVKTQSVESDVAIAVNDIAMKYELLTTQINSITNEHSFQPTEMELTATIIVLTLLSAVSLVCFVGVVVILVVINRKLKTAKAIRGIPTKPARRP